MSNKLEDWMNRKWRPAMGWMYMVVCITDFIIYPVLWAIFQDLNGIRPIKPWEPLTLQGAGLFHMAMGAVLGIAAWSRGQEKIATITAEPSVVKPVLSDPPPKITRNDLT
jgi:hypothetical protein